MLILFILIIYVFSAQKVHAVDSSLQSVNDYRSAHGLSALMSSDYLCDQAQKRADYLSEHNEFSHDGFHKLEPHWYFRKHGENLAKNATDEELVYQWSISPPHNEIMVGNFTHGCIRRKNNIVVFLVAGR